MFTFPILFKLDIILIIAFLLLILVVYATRLIAYWLESFEKELYWIKAINWAICDIAANLSIIMPILIILANLVFVILILV